MRPFTPKNAGAQDDKFRSSNGYIVVREGASLSNIGHILYYPTNEERSYAMLAHIVGIFSGFLAPVIMILIKKNSKFVLFHSLQSLLWHATIFVMFAGGIVVALFGLFVSGDFPPPDTKGDPPAAFFAAFGLIWFFALTAGITTLVLGISTGIKANRGEWAKYPLLGDFVLNKLLFDMHGC